MTAKIKIVPASELICRERLSVSSSRRLLLARRRGLYQGGEFTMISFEELIEEHEFDRDTVLQTVKRLKETDHLFLYQNHMFNSSVFGRQHLLMVGPGRSADDPANPPKEIDPDNCGGLPSRREQLVGEVNLEDVRKNS